MTHRNETIESPTSFYKGSTWRLRALTILYPGLKMKKKQVFKDVQKHHRDNIESLQAIFRRLADARKKILGSRGQWEK